MPRTLTAIFFLVLTAYSVAQDNPAHSGFTVRDDIALTQFGDPYYYLHDDIQQSPSGEYVVVHTFSSSLARNEIIDTLYVYPTAAVEDYLRCHDNACRIYPSWTVRRSSSRFFDDGPLITQLQWLRGNGSFAFLQRVSRHHHRLYVADLVSHQVTALSNLDEDVHSFSFADRKHFVYTVGAPSNNPLRKADLGYRIATGSSLFSLLHPAEEAGWVQRSVIWLVDGNSKRKLRFPETGKPIVLYLDGVINTSLSPNHTHLVTVVPVPNISREWQDRYLPPYTGSLMRLKAGPQDLDDPQQDYIGEYVSIDLHSGKVTHLTGGPASLRAGWTESIATAAWSDDSSAVILPGTFLRSNPHGAPPCVAVAEIKEQTTNCLQALKRDLPTGYEQGFKSIAQVRFLPHDSKAIAVVHRPDDSGAVAETRYVETSGGEWRRSEVMNPRSQLKFEVKADLTHPPVLIATDLKSHTGRTILDPNPQMRSLELGPIEPYTWKDDTGRKWQGVLYKPLHFERGKRYPLVIQNHSFSTTRFTPSGGFPSAFVAEELASAGIMVLHMRDCAGRGTPDEGPCNVRGYESAVNTLTSEGLIDPEKVGIIGFSRTVYYVLEALTTSKVHFKAASITDGITLGYFNYITDVGSNSLGVRTAESMIGGPPYGQELSKWLIASPDFHLDKVSAPIRIVSSQNVLQVWEPYALLQRMGKPVDLIVFDTHEHIFTEPRVRFAAQEGNVDWMRFWLQGWEDPSPTKRKQYERWRSFRDKAPRAAGRDGILYP